MHSNPELEARCREAPDDPGPWLAYADWLEQQGDPRGRLAALSRAGNAKAVERTIRTLSTELCPGVRAFVVTGWRHGFPIAAKLPARGWLGGPSPATVRAFVTSPLACFVEQLAIEGRYSPDQWMRLREAAGSVTIAKV